MINTQPPWIIQTYKMNHLTALHIANKYSSGLTIAPLWNHRVTFCEIILSFAGREKKRGGGGCVRDWVGGGFGRCYVAVWCQGSCEAWRRGVCSRPQFPLLLLETEGGKSCHWTVGEENGKTVGGEAVETCHGQFIRPLHCGANQHQKQNGPVAEDS